MMGSKTIPGAKRRRLMVRLLARAARENGQLKIFGEAFEQARAGNPAFAQNQTVVSIAQEQLLKMVLHFLEGRLDAAIAR